METVNNVELCSAFSRWICAGDRFGPVYSSLLNAEIPAISSALQCGSIMDGFWYERRRKSLADAS